MHMIRVEVLVSVAMAFTEPSCLAFLASAVQE